MASHGELGSLSKRRNTNFLAADSGHYLRALERGAPKHLDTDKICSRCGKKYSSELSNGPECLRCKGKQERLDLEQTRSARQNLQVQPNTI